VENLEKMVRRSSTHRPVSPAHKCKCFFLIHFDDKGFFVVPGIGNTKQSFHPKHGSLKCYLPPQLLDEVNKSFVEDVHSGSVLESISINVLYFRIGTLMSRKNFNYMKQNAEEIIDNDMQIKKKHIPSSDSMIINCERKGYDYMLLCQNLLNGSHPVSHTFSGNTGQISEDSITDPTNQEDKSTQQFIIEGRA